MHIESLGSRGFLLILHILISMITGRTGRFGRKGVAILFVYSERTWTQMHQIESAIDKEIVKIVADDFEEMEKVSNRACWPVGKDHFADGQHRT